MVHMLLNQACYLSNWKRAVPNNCLYVLLQTTLSYLKILWGAEQLGCVDSFVEVIGGKDKRTVAQTKPCRSRIWICRHTGTAFLGRLLDPLWKEVGYDSQPSSELYHSSLIFSHHHPTTSSQLLWYPWPLSISVFLHSPLVSRFLGTLQLPLCT